MSHYSDNYEDDEQKLRDLHDAKRKLVLVDLEKALKHAEHASLNIVTQKIKEALYWLRSGDE